MKTGTIELLSPKRGLRIEDLTGQKFKRLTVIEPVKKNKWGHWCWRCVCECGREAVVNGVHLKNGNTKSCGCLVVEHARKMSGAGEKNPRWKGGKIKNSGGYIEIKKIEHPNSKKNGYILEHVWVMANHLGRPLHRGEFVHHKNGIRPDNRLENLELWSTSHPMGHKINDKVEWCVQFLSEYAPEKLK